MLIFIHQQAGYLHHRGAFLFRGAQEKETEYSLERITHPPYI